jgi:hypothetical protein
MKAEGKKPLGKPRHRWKDNINLGFIQIVDRYVNMTPLTQDINLLW